LQLNSTAGRADDGIMITLKDPQKVELFRAAMMARSINA
jgi:hypothetical protein